MFLSCCTLHSKKCSELPVLLSSHESMSSKHSSFYSYPCLCSHMHFMQHLSPWLWNLNLWIKAVKVQTNVLLTTERHGPMWRAVAVSQNQSTDAEQSTSLLIVPFRPTIPLLLVSPWSAGICSPYEVLQRGRASFPEFNSLPLAGVKCFCPSVYALWIRWRFSLWRLVMIYILSGIMLSVRMWWRRTGGICGWLGMLVLLL